MTDSSREAAAPVAPPADHLPRSLLILLAALTALLPATVETFSPMLQATGEALGTRPGHVSAAMSAFVIAFAGAQIFGGALGDALGRRRVVLGGLVLYIAACVSASLATSFEMFVVAAMFMGLGSAAAVLLARTIVRDRLDRLAAAKTLATMGVLYGPVPILSPLLSGALVSLFGWRMPLLMLAALTAIILLMTLRHLPETLKPELRLPLHPVTVVRSFWSLARSRPLLAYVVGNAFAYSGIFIFASSAPQVIIGTMGNSTGHYAMMLALSTFGFMIGNMISRRLVHRFSIEGTLRIGALFLLGGGLVSIVTTHEWPLAWAALVLPQLLYATGWGVVQPQMQAGALSLHPRAIGQASALVGFAQLSIAGLIVAVFSRVTDGSADALSLGTLTCGLMAALFAWAFIGRGN
ncbi:MAG: MFS transporter [Sphingobium sp.]|nr:MFS transporter [Sphingobium sp.]